MWRFDATPRRIATLKGAATRPRVPVRRMEVAVGVGLDAPAMARAAIVPWLASRVSEKLLGDAQLLVSELVTNSVLHAQLPQGVAIRVSVEISDGFVRLEVEDAGAGAVVEAQSPDRESGGGFRAVPRGDAGRALGLEAPRRHLCVGRARDVVGELRWKT
jgi:Histidine kinase-like ATPase domain